MSAQPKSYLSPESYLEQEEKAEYKSEYYNGEIFAMAGASLSHNRIESNSIRSIGNRLKKGCEVFSSNMKVHVLENGLFTYPDVTVGCGKIELSPKTNTAITNPTLVIEILSDSTMGYHRGRKFELYRRIPSLNEYVLIHQDKAFIEYYRLLEGEWRLKEVSGINSVLSLEHLAIELPLAELYDSVEFA